eukprot:CAMPEP_0115847466 /NCGR_PEP_ID=MMETSP0287-20121206/10398_1 /TAXON_ID=412157 /ORGANISM="Chrysochromulina rotalis, Strain UIO044" /LENGTH=333 /DNA_ID=CAMNT_0003301303 /DNA_START=305 /DNA_END=1303 /DNA_ORIENTATION=-
MTHCVEEGASTLVHRARAVTLAYPARALAPYSCIMLRAPGGAATRVAVAGPSEERRAPLGASAPDPPLPSCSLLEATRLQRSLLAEVPPRSAGADASQHSTLGALPGPTRCALGGGRGRAPPAGRRAARLVVAAVHLALRIENAAPVVCVEALLRVHVEQHLHVAALRACREDGERAGRLQLARERADQRRRRAPRADELARLQIEGRAVERADDGAVLDGALVERRADVRAHVGGGEDLAALVRRDQDVLAGAEGSLERRRLKVLLGGDGGPHVLGGEVVRAHGATHHDFGLAGGHGGRAMEGESSDGDREGHGEMKLGKNHDGWHRAPGRL